MSRYRVLRWVVWLVLLFGASLVAPAIQVQGADVLVTDAGDAGPGTLRQAVLDAAPGDRIIVNTGGPITLTSGEIVLTKNVLIDFQGQSVTAAANNRVFTVNGGVTAELFNGSLFGNGLVPGNGGIILSSGSLLLNVMTIADGSAAQNGGGVYVDGFNALLQVRGSLIRDTEATSGGGLYIGSQAAGVFVDSTIRTSFLNQGTPADRLGAGIRSEGYLFVGGSFISSALQAHKGGGIYSAGRTLIVTQSIVTSSSATSSVTGAFNQGGGVYVTGTPTTALIIKSAVNFSRAEQGGGIYTDTSLDIANVTISSNVIEDFGGGAGVGGAGMYVAGGTSVLSFVTVADNDGIGVDDRDGIDAVGGTVVLQNTLLANTDDDNCFPVGGVGFTNESSNIDTGTSCGLGTANNSQESVPRAGLISALQSATLHELPAGSPAIDAVSDCTYSENGRLSFDINVLFEGYAPESPVTVDQRLAPRPAIGCDVGSYETTDPTLPPGVTIEKLFDIIVDEDGFSSAQYSVSLNSEPDSAVDITLTPDNQVNLVYRGEIYDNSTPLTIQFDTLTWAAAESITVIAVDDLIIEPDPHPATVTHTIASADPDYDTLTLPSLDFQVSDNDQTRTVTINSITIDEADTTMQFVVELSTGPSGGEIVIVDFTTADFSATAGVDYQAEAGRLIFRDEDGLTTTDNGERFKTIEIEINEDTEIELDEFFEVRLTFADGARILDPGSGIGTILDDDFFAPIDTTLDIQPETIPTAKVGTFYEVEFTITGGTPPLEALLTATPDLIGDDWVFETVDEGPTTWTVRLAGTPAIVQEITLSIQVTDAVGVTFTREYTFEATLTGEPSDPNVVASATPLSQAEIDATFEAVRRNDLGPPVVQIDPDTEIPEIYVRSGPADGATIINIAQSSVEYNVIGEYRYPGEEFAWYLIEYPADREAANSVNQVVGEDVTPLPIELERGWVYGRNLQLTGYILDIPILGNPFDNVNTNNTGITGQSVYKNNLYRYPDPDQMIVAQFDEGSTFQVLGRTRVDQRDITFWILVRLDQTGQVGWVRWTPYTPVSSDLNGIPQY